jgi:hypothetical protein
VVLGDSILVAVRERRVVGVLCHKVWGVDEKKKKGESWTVYNHEDAVLS